MTKTSNSEDICKLFIATTKKTPGYPPNIISGFHRSNLFRSFFAAEKSSEILQPVPFSDMDDPSNLWIEKVPPSCWNDPKEFNLALLNGDLLKKQFTEFTEYEVVFLVDISMSMLKRHVVYNEKENVMNWETAHTCYGEEQNSLFTKWAMEMYLLINYIQDAEEQGLKVRVIPFGCNQLIWGEGKIRITKAEELLLMLNKIVEKQGEATQNYDDQDDNSMQQALELLLSYDKKRSVFLFTDFLVPEKSETILHQLIQQINWKYDFRLFIFRDPYEKGLNSEIGAGTEIEHKKILHDCDNVNSRYLKKKFWSQESLLETFFQESLDEWKQLEDKLNKIMSYYFYNFYNYWPKTLDSRRKSDFEHFREIMDRQIEKMKKSMEEGMWL